MATPTSIRTRGSPVVSADWARFRQVELVPFRAAIDAGAALVMSAHIALPALEVTPPRRRRLPRAS
ncbi:MAG: hypothetical protein IPJ56_15790 [Gemmatimonadetes bacterium]|nr:hypothetical protein [Gemmatimonadota bacterium]